jgi:hypothetical protein
VQAADNSGIIINISHIDTNHKKVFHVKHFSLL